MSATAAEKYQLPSIVTLEEAEQALTDAHVALERVTWSVEHAADSGDAGEGMAVLPTRADIGELHLFAHYARLRSDEFREMADRIEGSLPTLADMAGNAGRREKARDDS